MKRLAIMLTCSLALVTPAAAFTADDMVNTPNEFSQFWSDFAVQAYSCTNEFEATLKIVRFDGALDYFPRVARNIKAGGPSVVLETSSFSKLPMDTLIVSEGLATVISSIAGRSLIGVSEDTTSHFSAGHYTAVTTYPKYNASNVGGPNFMRHRLMQGGDVEISGIVLDKQSDQLSALVLQNQAEAGQRPRFEAYEDQYACQPVAKEELKPFAAGAVRTVVVSMADIRDAAAQSVQGQKPELKPQLLPEKKPQRRLTATSPVTETAPEQILGWPDDYIENFSKQVRFALTCTDVDGETVRITMFNVPLAGFPLLHIEHNERELKQARIYSLDRLTVSTQLKATRSDDKYNALVIIDGKAGDEIFPAGLTFLVEMATRDTHYEAPRGRPLRDGGSLPTAMLPPITTYPEADALHFSLDRVLIDRVTLNTTVDMSWPLSPRVRVKNICTISETPQQDSAKMLRESFDAIKSEQKRVTRSGTANRL